MELRIEPRRAALSLFACAVLLIATHFAMMISRYVLGHGRLLGLVDSFNVNVENNVPTFFSAFLLVTCAALLVVAARVPSFSASERRHWGWLAVIFLFLALDEDASIHELFIGPMRHFLPKHGPLHFGWVVPYAFLALGIGIAYLRFVLRLPEPTRQLVFAAGCLYLAGCGGFEMVGGWYISEVSGDMDLAYMTIVGCEEFLEMSGAILFIYAILDYLRRSLGGTPVAIRLGSP